MSTHKNLLQNSDVTSLISIFQGLSGFQRSNRFIVDIIPPTKLSQLWGTVPRLFASYVQIPSQVINYYQDSMAPSGAYIDIPVKRDFDDRFIIDFIVDSNWECRRFFDDWMEFMFQKNPSVLGSKNSWIINWWSEIVGTVFIYALDTNGAINRKIKLVDAWPSTILPTQMMNDTPNDYLTLSIDMNYRYYENYDKNNTKLEIRNDTPPGN